ncbi:MAG: excinuclease ABC subunit UvrA [Desulfobacterales bacterium]|nr:excinuclease ABC subunit UvrA [Desulfobacterales bacterium]MBF0395701.1 excinuclease ABC subunit UvrA [Desulfobacterales bacterium]
MESDKIIIRGAKEHNLKNIDVDLPRNKLIVITGLSGSGKSTLAFDTLYAEGQRRYVESLSTYARQFLERMNKPDVELIEGLSPAIAIEQKTASHNPRSTVGTVTEIYDYLRLLYARIGDPHCYQCGKPISSQSIDQIVDRVMSFKEGTKIIILSPLISGLKGTHEKLFVQLKKDGFSRVRVNGQIMDIEEVGSLPKTKKHTIDVVVDRIVIKENIKNRLADSIELAIKSSEGLVTIEILGESSLLFSEKKACITCGISYPEFTPASFSFNSPQGACPKCDGLGSITEIDPDLIVPNHDLSLEEGAISPWSRRNTLVFVDFLDALTSHYKVDVSTPFKNLSDNFKNIILYGSGNEPIKFHFEQNNRRMTYEKPFEGVIPNLSRRYKETDSQMIRDEIREYMKFMPCPECLGKRLKKESLSVRVGGYTIHETTSLSVEKAHLFFKELKLDKKKQIIAERILKEIIERLGFLESVGLNYLTLDRTASTLSGGESQRIRLATQIGSKLTGVLYVLDEPSIGLHQRDNQKLLATLTKMRDLGNTVLVVEHDEETILSSDYVVDMGPGAGVHGGEIVFSGPPNELLTHDKSLTGEYLSLRKQIEIPKIRRIGNGKKLTIEGACGNNLKNIKVDFPLGSFICITGVSGSGKSTLVIETLYHILSRSLYKSDIYPAAYSQVTGIENIDKVVNIDQSPIGRTPRSNPGTYTGLFTFIRELFSKTSDSRVRGYKPGRFSFNVKGGRCETCMGDGIIKIEMHFLPDVYVACDVCNGKRYNRETLEIKYRGKSISDVLDMTVDQALLFFENIQSIRNKLETLSEVGIGYIRLGQSATTLSGGEAQRIKLSRELSKRGTGKTIYILDEPTTGLHIDDVKKLLHVLNRLVEMGNTVIVIEHNLDVIKYSDYIIDLGPEGGDKGGYVIGYGSPEELIQIKESYTGQFLEKILKHVSRKN